MYSATAKYRIYVREAYHDGLINILAENSAY